MGEICGEDIRYLLDSNLKKIPWVAKDPAGAVAKAKLRAAGIPDEQMRETARDGEGGAPRRGLAARRGVGDRDRGGDARVRRRRRVGRRGRRLTRRSSGATSTGTTSARCTRAASSSCAIPRRATRSSRAASPGIPGVLTGMNDAGVFTADLVQFAKTKEPRRATAASR